MKIKIHRIKRMTIEQFADKHGLTMEVHERSSRSLPRFYADFVNAEISDGCILISAFGDGNNPEEAIAAYAKRISGKVIVVNAASRKKRKEIKVPSLS